MNAVNGEVSAAGLWQQLCRITFWGWDSPQAPTGATRTMSDARGWCSAIPVLWQKDGCPSEAPFLPLLVVAYRNPNT